MKKEHVYIIGKFYNHESLKELSVYGGYKGDKILKLCCSRGLANLVEDECDKYNIEVHIKKNSNIGWYEAFVVAPDDVYTLKR